MGGWTQFGKECLLLSSEIIRGSVADPKESCRKRKARTLLTYSTNYYCFLRFYIASPTVVAVEYGFSAAPWQWLQREILGNCTSLKEHTERGVSYAKCGQRIYFACVQG